MKFQFIQPVSSPVMTYQGMTVSTGDIVDFNDHFSAKAARNPHYIEYVEKTPEIENKAPETVETVIKKRGRPSKNGN